MDLRRLGPSDIEISRVGVGTAPIGSRPGLEFVLSHPAVTGAIVGIRTEREGRALAAAA
jgi:aryl-alcohol dehydrogenase-like predicted oxidoreductase